MGAIRGCFRGSGDIQILDDIPITLELVEISSDEEEPKKEDEPEEEPVEDQEMEQPHPK